MDIDEEDAPALVDIYEVKETVQNGEAMSVASQLPDLSLVKVPLSIVTGEPAKLSGDI